MLKGQKCQNLNTKEIVKVILHKTVAVTKIIVIRSLRTGLQKSCSKHKTAFKHCCVIDN